MKRTASFAMLLVFGTVELAPIADAEACGNPPSIFRKRKARKPVVVAALQRPVVDQSSAPVVTNAGGTWRHVMSKVTDTTVDKPVGGSVRTAQPSTGEEVAKASRVGAADAPDQRELFFSRGRSTVDGGSDAVDAAARWLASHPAARVRIEGHTDPTGTPAGNLALGQARAEHVRDALVRAGIDAHRIDVVSHGATKPRYDATDRRNRRVVIEIAPAH